MSLHRCGGAVRIAGRDAGDDPFVLALHLRVLAAVREVDDLSLSLALDRSVG